MPRILPHLFRTLMAAALFVAASGIARADVLYSQAPDFPPNNFGFFTSSTTPNGGGFRTYDSFVLPQASTITAFTWQGFYYDFVNLGNNPVNPSTTSWQIGIFADTGAGLPGTALSSQTLPASSVDVQFVADAIIFDARGSPVRILQFRADLPTSFDAEAGVSYFFSPLSIQPTFPPLFGWTSSAMGDSASVQQSLPGGALNRIVDRDRAFTVEGVAAIPEPATWMLMSLGLVNLAALRARFRRRAPDAAN